MNALCRSLEENSIRTVSLQGTPCSDEVAVANGERLADNESVTLCHFSASSFSSSGLAHVCQGLQLNRNVEEISINGGELNEQKSCALAKVLQNNTYISSFKLARCKLDERAALELSRGLYKSQGLRELSLCRNGLSNQCMHYICEGIVQHPTLTHLSVDIEPIDDRGITMLCDMLQANRSITSFFSSTTLHSEMLAKMPLRH